MFLQRGNEHLARQDQETLVKAPGNADRPFHERGHFFDQAIVDQGAAAEIGCGLFHLFDDTLPANVRVDHDPGVVQRLRIVVGARELDRRRVMEAMAEGLAVRALFENVERHDLIAVQGDDPVNRAYEGGFTVAPAHQLGDGQTLDRLIDRGLDQRSDRLARLGGAIDQAFALVAILVLERVHGRAQRARKAFGGLGGLAGLVIGNGKRRPGFFHGDGVGGLGDIGDRHGQSARRGITRRSTQREPGFGQRAGDAVGKGIGKRTHGFGGQFFHPDFDE